MRRIAQKTYRKGGFWLVVVRDYPLRRYAFNSLNGNLSREFRTNSRELPSR